MRVVSVGFLLCVLLSGCRGIGSSGMVPPVGSGTASFSINVPPPAKGAAPSMQSLIVSLDGVNGQPPSTAVAPFRMNLTKSTPGCSTVSDGSITCTAKLSVPAGSDSFTVTTFALPNQTGARVYSNKVTTRISAGRATTCEKRK